MPRVQEAELELGRLGIGMHTFTVNIDGLGIGRLFLAEIAKEQSERQDTQDRQQQGADDGCDGEIEQQTGDDEDRQEGDVLGIVDSRLLGSVEALPEVVGEVVQLLEQNDCLFFGAPEEDLDFLPGFDEKGFETVEHGVVLSCLE